MNKYVYPMQKRSYSMKRRAESQEATRARIVDALVELHEELGPRNATISAIAERAGVQRLTVYRHFPDEAELFEACTSYWLEQHPPPDPHDWSDVADVLGRCRAALGALYRYYRATERMWTVSFRDEAEVPALQGPMRAFRDHLDAIGADLLSALKPKRRRKETAATVAHALQFSTWASLAAEDLSDNAAAALVMSWIKAATEGEAA